MINRSLFLTYLLCSVMVLSPVSTVMAGNDALAPLDGAAHKQMISPAGDILNAGMEALAPLQIAPIEMPEAGITADIFADPKKASEQIKRAFFLPESEKERGKITADEQEKIIANRQLFLNQIASYAISLGKLVEGNIEKFNERRNNALKFVASAQNNREAIQVMNGISLGQLSETEKLLGMNTTFMILQLSDVLSEPEGLEDTSSEEGNTVK